MDSKRIILFFVFSLAVFDIFLWAAVFNGGGGDKLQIYFLNVGQGDSELLVLPGVKPAKILIDSGPNGSAVKELDKILPFFSVFFFLFNIFPTKKTGMLKQQENMLLKLLIL